MAGFLLQERGYTEMPRGSRWANVLSLSQCLSLGEGARRAGEGRAKRGGK